MAVAQLTEHIGQHLEELVIVIDACRAYLIYMIDGIPVETILMGFVVEETVMLVDDMPKGLEVAFGGIVVLGLIDTGR